jgi:putative addiction module killer protein
VAARVCARRPSIRHPAPRPATARAKVTGAFVRLEQGNLSNVKSVGEGVLEYQINFGPGYRV